MPIAQSRRHLLTNIAVAGATGFAGLGAAGFYGGGKSLAASLWRCDVDYLELGVAGVRPSEEKCSFPRVAGQRGRGREF